MTDFPQGDTWSYTLYKRILNNSNRNNERIKKKLKKQVVSMIYANFHKELFLQWNLYLYVYICVVQFFYFFLENR